MIHEPDVALTDYLLCLETGTFAVLLWRHREPLPARRVAALIFACLAASSLTGGSYHGFFPGKTDTPGGWIVWTTTMLILGVCASLAWAFFALVCGVRSMRTIVPPLVAIFAIYAWVVTRVDHRFLVSAIFSTPPVLCVLGLMLVRGLRDGHRNGLVAAGAILLMLLAAVLQQLHVGLHPVWFNHNALYHVLEGAALALLYVALKNAPAANLR